MQLVYDKVLQLLDYVKIDSYTIECHFKCKESQREVVSHVPFEPFAGKREFTWKEILLHPIKSYNKYYHTPIIIYGGETHETIVLKAFKKVSHRFVWNGEKKQYICSDLL